MMQVLARALGLSLHLSVKPLAALGRPWPSTSHQRPLKNNASKDFMDKACHVGRPWLH